MSTTRFSDLLLTALAPMIWGSTYIVTTELLPADRPFMAALLRTLPAGILLVILSLRYLKHCHWLRLIVLSALNIGVFQAFLFVAAYRLPGGLAAVLGAVQPLIVMGLIWGCDQQRPAQLAVWASVTGIIGMAALLLAPGAVWDPVGIAAALTGAICMAGGTYLTRRWRSDLPVLAMTGWQLFLGGLMLLPIALIVDPPLPSLSSVQIAGYVYLSLFGALLAYALWFRGIIRLSPVAVSSLGLLSPLTAVILGWLLLDQHMTGIALLGLVTVLGSILAVQRASAPKAPHHTNASVSNATPCAAKP